MNRSSTQLLCKSKRKITRRANAKSPSEGTELAAVRNTVEGHFPHLWPAVEAGLSVCATLLLKDNGNPSALIYLGPSSTGKTTVASMFDGAKVKGKELVYRSDKFSEAAFVSASGNTAKGDLKDIHLLLKIKHRILLTPDLGTIFRGKYDELTGRFSTITRVLDGQGFTRDSGTHGQVGETGDFLHAWLGCTTPFTKGVWEVMATLGSRLFFFTMDDGAADPDVDELVGSVTKAEPYHIGIQKCREAVHTFLETLFVKNSGVRGVEWQNRNTPTGVAEVIACFAKILAVMRTHISRTEDLAVKPESPHRAYAVLYNIARGHALLHGRTQLTNDDLPIIAKIALSSMPEERRAVLEGFVKANGDPLSAAEVAHVASVSRNTAEDRIMPEFEKLKIARHNKPGIGKASSLILAERWKWCAADEVGRLIREVATSQKSGGECDDLYDEERDGDEDDDL